MLYRSERAVLPYFRIHDLLSDAGVCLCSNPRHVIYFRVMASGVVRISNELIAIDSATAASVSRAIFSQCPGVDRVVWTHIRGDLGRCGLPRLVQEAIQDWRIDLPPRAEDGRPVLGRSTRKHRNAKWNRLRRAFADAQYRVIEREEIDASIVHELVEMNRTRLSQKRLVSGYDMHPQREARLVATLQEYGFGILLHADGKLIAGLLCSEVDAACFTDLVGIDEDYEPFSPGMMCFWTAIEESVRRGAVSLHLGWGTEGYKQRLGAHADNLWTVTLYRSRVAQMRHWRETAVVANTRARRAAVNAYHDARRKAGPRIKKSLAETRWPLVTAASHGSAQRPVAAQAKSGQGTNAVRSA